MVHVLTLEEYKKVTDNDSDYCDCCGGLYQLAGLTEGTMPVEDTLSGGFTVCYLCSQHCEDGPCEPSKVVSVLQPGIKQEDTKAYRWVLRKAGLAATFEFQDDEHFPAPAGCDYTTILGKVGDAFIVLAEGTAYDHSTPFPVLAQFAVSGNEEKPIVEDATEAQLKAVGYK